MDIVKTAQRVAMKHSNLIIAGAAVIASAGVAAADITTAGTNGSSILTTGIGVAKTEPLNWFFDSGLVGYGALLFVKVYRRLF